MRWFVQLGRAYNVVGRGTAEVAIGDPAREIVRAATERDTSLVVVGMRGADKAPPGSIGSVTRELLTRGPMPVLAVNAI
jgi:nucleotide-binding universal stress UspA family protein